MERPDRGGGAPPQAGVDEALVAMRAALLGCWADEHAATGTQPRCLSAFMCRKTARAMLAMLGEGAGGWRAVAGGMRMPDGKAWRDHAWISNGRHILDFTADQFGHAEIICCAADDGRYLRDPAVTARFCAWAADASPDTPWPGAAADHGQALRAAGRRLSAALEKTTLAEAFPLPGTRNGSRPDPRSAAKARIR